MTAAIEAGRWRVVRRQASAGVVHDDVWPEPLEPQVWVVEVTGAALVLGSAQRRLVEPATEWVLDHGVDLEVVARRSGGGAVWLAPGSQLWVDVFVPPGDPRWVDDLRASVAWLGQVWAEAIAAAVPGESPEVHHGGLVTTPWSSHVCFAGLGPGEISVDGAKVVGISQRRTRTGARFQCTALLEWRPEPMAAVLAAVTDVPVDRSPLASCAAGLDVGADILADAFLAALARW